jgi:hypothetical protein
MKATDEFYIKQEEPLRSFYLALREIILLYNENITESMKYGMPFFSFKGKMFCYFWFHKKYQKPYIGWVEGGYINHPDLLKESRSRMKIYLLDPVKDIPVDTIKMLLEKAISFYTSGMIKIKSK